MAAEPTYLSDARPDFAPLEESCGTITGFAYAGDLATELAAGTIEPAEALDLLDDMLAIRELEEMIVRLRSGGYDPLPGYDYRGPTHVSIGQEGTAVGASAALRAGCWSDRLALVAVIARPKARPSAWATGWGEILTPMVPVPPVNRDGRPGRAGKIRVRGPGQ